MNVVRLCSIVLSAHNGRVSLCVQCSQAFIVERLCFFVFSIGMGGLGMTAWSMYELWV